MNKYIKDILGPYLKPEEPIPAIRKRRLELPSLSIKPIPVVTPQVKAVLKTERPNFLMRLIDTLNLPLYAVQHVLQGKPLEALRNVIDIPLSAYGVLTGYSPVETVKGALGSVGIKLPDLGFLDDLGRVTPQERTSFRETMKAYDIDLPGGWLGFGAELAGDILLDPLMYVTFGTLSAAKLGAKAGLKGGMKAATKAGEVSFKKGLQYSLTRKGLVELGERTTREIPDITATLAKHKHIKVAEPVVKRLAERKAARKWLGELPDGGWKALSKDIQPLFDPSGIKYGIPFMQKHKLIPGPAVKKFFLKPAAAKAGQAAVEKATITSFIATGGAYPMYRWLKTAPIWAGARETGKYILRKLGRPFAHAGKSAEEIFRRHSVEGANLESGLHGKVEGIVGKLSRAEKRELAGLIKDAGIGVDAYSKNVAAAYRGYRKLFKRLDDSVENLLRSKSTEQANASLKLMHETFTKQMLKRSPLLKTYIRGIIGKGVSEAPPPYMAAGKMIYPPAKFSSWEDPLLLKSLMSKGKEPIRSVAEDMHSAVTAHARVMTHENMLREVSHKLGEPLKYTRVAETKPVVMAKAGEEGRLPVDWGYQAIQDAPEVRAMPGATTETLGAAARLRIPALALDEPGKRVVKVGMGEQLSQVGPFPSFRKDVEAFTQAEQYFTRVGIPKLGARGDIAAVLSDVMEPMKGIPYFTAVTRKLIKPLLTVWHPSFHTRNFISGMLGMGVMDPNTGLRMLTRKGMGTAVHGMRRTGKTLDLGIYGKLTGKEFGELAAKHGVTSRHEMVLEMSKLVEGKGKLAKALKFPIPIGPGGREFAGLMEDFMRLNAFGNNLRVGLAPAEAARNVGKFFIDYMPASRWEVILRDIIPFYKFTREAIPTYLTEMVRRPGLAAPLRHIHEDKNRPSWMKEAEALPWGKKSLLTGFSFMPWSVLNDLATGEGVSRTIEKSVIGKLNPMVKWLYELPAGRKAHWGEKVRGREKALWLMKWFGLADKKGYTSGSLQHDVMNLLAPLGRFITTIDKFDWSREQKRSLTGRLVKLFTGVAVYDIDLDKNDYWRMRDSLSEALKYTTDEDVRKGLERILKHLRKKPVYRKGKKAVSYKWGAKEYRKLAGEKKKRKKLPWEK